MTEPTTTDWRALCAELLADLEYVCSEYHVPLQCAMMKARTALAQPEPQGPSDEELVKHYDRAVTSAIAIRVAVRALTNEDRDAATVAGLRAVLARWGRPAIEPVPVSERLPGPEDCDAEGRCWVFDDMLGLPSWTLIKVLGKNLEPDMTWLPHWALPVPGVEGGDA
jgi:hypothetical protein